MDARQIAGRMQYGVVVVWVIAMALCVWAFVLGVLLAVDSSIPGGLAEMVIAAIMLTVIGWRVSFKWKQLRGPSRRDIPR